jgi:hypothetical protein
MNDKYILMTISAVLTTLISTIIVCLTFNTLLLKYVDIAPITFWQAMLLWICIRCLVGTNNNANGK